jgi:hypothetical protein
LGTGVEQYYLSTQHALPPVALFLGRGTDDEPSMSACGFGQVRSRISYGISAIVWTIRPDLEKAIVTLPNQQTSGKKRRLWAKLAM